MTLAASVLGVCMVLAAAPDVAPRFVPVREFTLAWTHSIEKLRWEEDYVVLPSRNGDSQPMLVAGKARIKGSGAGMEPPPDAVFKEGWYEYQPPGQLPQQLRLTRSIYTADYEWCVGGSCKPLSAVMPTDGGITLLYPCRKPNRPA